MIDGGFQLGDRVVWHVMPCELGKPVEAMVTGLRLDANGEKQVEIMETENRATFTTGHRYTLTEEMFRNQCCLEGEEGSE